MLAALLSAPGTAWSQAAGGGGLPPTIPLFPLQDVMLFPEMSRPLHIFEQRYRDMVTDAVQGDGLIGMVMLRPGYEADYRVWQSQRILPRGAHRNPLGRRARE